MQKLHVSRESYSNVTPPLYMTDLVPLIPKQTNLDQHTIGRVKVTMVTFI